MANLTELRRVFDIVDENRDGMVRVDEIYGFMINLRIQISEEDVRSMVIPLSTASDCSLQFEEFVHLYHSIFKSDEEENESNGGSQDLMEAFRVFDRNEDGYISPTELQEVLSAMGLLIPQKDELSQDCQKMICRFDSDSNGLLDFTEFKHMISSKF